VAAALDAEYSQVAWASQSWIAGGQGWVPPFNTPGDQSRSAWQWLWKGRSRSFEGLDYIFVLMGANDSWRCKTATSATGVCPAGNVTKSAADFMQRVRLAAGSTPHIFIVVPFGSWTARREPVGALPAAYQASAADPRLHYIDLGERASIGLDSAHYLTPSPLDTVHSCDGVHPRSGTNAVSRSAELAAMIAVSAVTQVLR